jgi:hypothetical protein
VDQRRGRVELSRHRPRSDEAAEMTNRRHPGDTDLVGRLRHRLVLAFAHCQLCGPYLAESEPYTRSLGPDRDAAGRPPTHAMTVSEPATRRSVATPIRSLDSTGATAPVVQPRLVDHDGQRGNGGLLPVLRRHQSSPGPSHHHGRRAALHSRHGCHNDGPCRAEERGFSQPWAVTSPSRSSIGVGALSCRIECAMELRYK